MTDHAHRAPFRSTAWSSIDDALAEFLAAPASPPGDLFYGAGESWTNEGIVVHRMGARGIYAPDKATFDAVRVKYDAPAVETFIDAFVVLGRACGKDWARFDLECLRECCEAFAALELPAWVHDAKDRDPEDFLVSQKPALFMSNDMTWCTPEVVLERVRRVGKIGLDPCSNGRSIVHARIQFRGPPGEDGLAEQWTGYLKDGELAYVNPPYGRAIGQWVAKCALETMDGAEVILLVPARPDTAWWHDAVLPHATAICSWRGRLAFLGASQGAPFPSAVVYYGARPEAFAEAFDEVGSVSLRDGQRWRWA